MSDPSHIPFINVGEGRLNVFFHGAGLFLTKLKLFGEGVEVGVCLGDWSNDLLSTWKGKKLWCVDPWTVQPPSYPDTKWSQAHMDIFYQRTKNRLAVYGERNEIVRLPSLEAVKLFKDGQLDFVYIDALHTEANLTDDMEAWWPKVREGGLFFGDDYRTGPWAGVIEAVDKFSEKYKVGVYFPKSGFDKPRNLKGVIDSGLDDWIIFK